MASNRVYLFSRLVGKGSSESVGTAECALIAVMAPRPVSITARCAGHATPAPMKSILRLLMSGLLLAVLVFCVFGFMATYEPMRTVTRWTWRAIYSIAGIFTLGGLATTWRSKKPKELA